MNLFRALCASITLLFMIEASPVHADDLRIRSECSSPTGDVRGLIAVSVRRDDYYCKKRRDYISCNSISVMKCYEYHNNGIKYNACTTDGGRNGIIFRTKDYVNKCQ